MPHAETSVYADLFVTATVVSRLTRDNGNMLINDWFNLNCQFPSNFRATQLSYQSLEGPQQMKCLAGVSKKVIHLQACLNKVQGWLDHTMLVLRRGGSHFQLLTSLLFTHILTIWLFWLLTLSSVDKDHLCCLWSPTRLELICDFCRLNFVIQ